MIITPGYRREAGFIWAAYLLGGYWYVAFYTADKELIKAGPWPFAHSFFMESKEHVFLVLENGAEHHLKLVSHYEPS